MPLNLSADLDKYVEQLRDEFFNEGITAWKSETVVPGGFQRVFFSKGGQRTEGMADLYLDLRLGLETPWGRTVEMASTTPGTYGIPGFARHIAGQATISSPHETFKDYIRSIYSAAQSEQKLPKEVAWGVYQGGYPSRMYPGARSWGTEEGYQSPFMPQAGGIITPGASTGTRRFMSRTVRYFVEEGADEQKYVTSMLEQLKTGKGPFGLIGRDLPYAYAPELSKWKSWIPIAGDAFTTHLPGFPEESPTSWVFTPRGAKGTMKSVTMATEARELANRPLMRDPTTGRLVHIEPSQARKDSYGVRTGWTKSTIILPGETDPRTVYAGQTGFVDQPELPGAVLASKGAFTYDVKEGGETRRIKTYGIGNEGAITYRFGTGSIGELMGLVEKGGLNFKDVEGLRVRSGPGKYSLGSYSMAPKGQEQPVERTILIDRKDYDYRLGKPTLYVPEFYDPTKEDLPFSNVPIEDERKNLMRTDATVKELKRRFGDRINIVQQSGIGTGSEEHPAEVYMTVGIDRIMPFSFKTAGVKGYLAQTAQDFSLQLFGVERAEGVHQEFITQEGKIPARNLMSAFGVMERNTQKKFLTTFLPQETRGQRDALAALEAYIDDSYSSTEAVGISADRMAEIWRESTGKPMSADLLFSMAFNNILKIQATGDVKAARMMWGNFRIGVTTEQMAPGLRYSKSNAAETNRLLSDLGPEASGLISFEERPLDKLLRSTGAFESEISLMNSKYRVASGGGVSMVAGLSAVPEYPSASSYINSKAIESLLTHWPQASRAMGIADEQGMWAGVFSEKAYSGGMPPPHVRGWNELNAWGIVQGELNKGNVTIPNESLGINPELASALNDVINRAEGMSSDKAILEELKAGLENINVETMGYAKVNLADTFLYDPNTNTLAPKLTSIMDVESYAEGVQEGKSRTYWGQNYLRLLKAVVESSASDPGAMFNIVGTARNKFMNKLQRAFYPEGKRSKGIFRNIVGMQLPGTRGGRYQGMTELETGEAYADDQYIIRMLGNSGFKTRKQIDSILRYLNTATDAYLPILFQRQPDISTEYQIVPMKLRSKKWLLKAGISPPEGPAGKDLIYIATNANRFQVGDFDGDFGAAKLLPIFDAGKIDDRTRAWAAPAAVQQEFDYHFSRLHKTPGAVDAALTGMFQEYGAPQLKERNLEANIKAFQQSLDVARKNFGDYIAAATGQSSLEARLEEPEAIRYSELLSAAADVKEAKSGMGSAYNVRTLTTDVAAAVLGLSPDDLGVFSQAYETGAMPYQAYLDRLAMMRGGFTQLETMMSSIGIYGVGGEPGSRTYRVSYKMTQQGQQVDLQGKDIWPKAGGSGLVRSAYMLNNLIGGIAGSPKLLMSDAMLAWGFGATGRKQEVLEALQNPTRYWTGTGRSPGVVGGWLPETREDRATILRDMVKTGAVGFNSPYYVMLTHSAINRLRKSSPELLQDPSIALPWGDAGEMTPVADIMQSREYQVAEALNNLVISGGEFMTPESMKLLSSLGGTRLGALASGVYKTFERITGGFINADIAEKEYGERARAAYKVFRSNMQPVVNASELGALLPIKAAPLSETLKQQGWSGVSPRQMAETTYKTVLRSMGLEFLVGDVAEGGAQFVRSDWPSLLKKFAGGIDYEKMWGEKHPEFIQTAQAESMKFKVGGITVHGKPDFIRYDSASNEIVIVDTKSPWSREEEGIAYTEAFATHKAKKYQYRAQLMSYAYGMEKLGTELPEDKWEEMLTDWGVDKSAVPRWRDAAARGAIRMEIAPGRVAPGGELQEFTPIVMKWDAERRQEYEDIVGVAKTNVFSPKFYGYVAAETYSTLKTERRVPRELAGYRRSGLPANPSMFAVMKIAAEDAGYTVRAAGGGRFDRISGKRIRVGEGGPEELIIGKHGVSVVPASETTEARAARGEYFPIEGYRSNRYQGGVVDDDDIEASGFIGESSEEPINEPEVPIDEPAEAAPTGFSPDVLSVYNPALGDSIDTLSERIEAIRQQLEYGMPRGFGGAAPNVEGMHRRLAGQVGKALAYVEPLKAYEKDIRRTIAGLMSARGGEYATAAASYSERVAGGSLLNMIQPGGGWTLPRKEWMPELRRQGLVERAKGPLAGARALVNLGGIIQQGGGFGALLASYEFEPEQQDQIRRLRELIETPEGSALIREGGGAAELITSLARTEPEFAKQKMTGGSAEAYEKLAASMGKLEEASTNLAEAQKNQKDITKETTEVQKASLEVRRDEARVMQETIKRQYSGLFTREGKFIGMEEATRRATEGELTEADWAMAGKFRTAAAQEASAQRQIERIESGGEDWRGTLGKVSRRMLGGFGLMYLRSIGNIMTGPGMMGYEEAIQGQAQAEAALGSVYGGMEMYTSPEARIRRAQRARGGLGGFGLRGLYASALENPLTAGLMSFAQTGVGAGGMAMFLADMLGAPAAAVPGVGIAAGVAASVGSIALGAMGAASQPEETAISLMSRRNWNSRTRDFRFNNFGDLLGGLFEGDTWAWVSERLGGGGGTVGPIEQQIKQIRRLQELQAENPSINLSETGASDRTISAYARMLSNIYATEPQYTFQALQLQQTYGVPLGTEAGGGLEHLAVLLQQGQQVEQVARIAAYSPWLTGAQQAQLTGQNIARYTAGGMPSLLQQQYMQEGATFVERLGIMAPQFGPVAGTIPEDIAAQLTEIAFGTGGVRAQTGTIVPPNVLAQIQASSMPSALSAIREYATADIIPGIPALAEVAQTPQTTAELEEWIGREMSPIQRDAALRRAQIEQQRRQMGLSYTPVDMNFLQGYADMGEEELVAQTRIDRFDELATSFLDKITTTFQQLGQMLPDVSGFDMMTFGQRAVGIQAGAFGFNLSQQMLRGGGGAMEAQNMGALFALMGSTAAGQALLPTYEGLAQFNRQRWGAYLLQNQEVAQQLGSLSVPGIGGSTVSLGNFQYVGVDNAGQLTGLEWGRTSLATAMRSSQDVAMQLWGTTGEQGSLIEALVQGGTRQGQIWQQQQAFQQQRAQLGISWEQLQLQRWYMPQQFALQARGRQLSYAQTEWGLQQQQEQLDIGRQNFAVTMGLQYQQMQMQRGWTQEDWRYQGQVRAMQWGWQQEDYAENLRFMTGRQRRLAERQMGRQTILHDLESEQIEKQQGRQRELWALEDARFTQQIAYQESLFNLQQRNINQQEEFYHVSRQLQEEQAALSEEYWRRSIELQERALGISEHYMSIQQETFEIMQPLNALLEDVQGSFNLLGEESLPTLLAILREIDPVLAELFAQAAGLGIIRSSVGGQRDDAEFRQHGGRVYPGESYFVGERGIELFRPDVSGEVVPIDPWNTSFVSNVAGAPSGNGAINLVIYLGNDQLYNGVVDVVDQEIRL